MPRYTFWTGWQFYQLRSYVNPSSVARFLLLWPQLSSGSHHQPITQSQTLSSLFIMFLYKTLTRSNNGLNKRDDSFNWFRRLLWVFCLYSYCKNVNRKLTTIDKTNWSYCLCLTTITRFRLSYDPLQEVVVVGAEAVGDILHGVVISLAESLHAFTNTA